MSSMRRVWLAFLLMPAGCPMSKPPAPVPDSGPPPGCDDVDADGYGAGDACLGLDCDDADPERHGGCEPCDTTEPEPCYDGPPGTAYIGLCTAGLRWCRNGVWTACQDEVLPGVESCDYTDEDCDGVVDDGVQSACGDCSWNCHAACAGVGCPAALEARRSAEQTDDGAVRVAAGAPDLMPRLVWVPSSLDDLVYAVATGSHETIGTYAIPHAEASSPGAVVMDLRGNAFVLRVGAPLVTRIDAADCADRDGDGVLETSTGRADVFAEDECVRWSAEPDCGLDDCGVARSIALGEGGRVVWVGLQDPDRLAQLDAETGAPTLVGAEIFGDPWAIVPSREGLWLSTGPVLCSVSAGGEIDGCQAMPDGGFYRRIDVDSSGLVYGGPPLTRFDPVTDAFEWMGDGGASLAIDDDGDLWALGGEGGDAGSLSRFRNGQVEGGTFALAHAAFDLAADLEGQLWTVSWTTGAAAILEATEAEEIALLFDDCDRAGGCLGTAGLAGDPTGIRLRRTFPELVENAEATAAFEAECESWDQPWFREIRWVAVDAAGLALDARVAASGDELARQPWVFVTSTDEATGEVSLPEALGDFGHPFIEVRARLRGAAAKLDRLEVRWGCQGGDWK